MGKRARRRAPLAADETRVAPPVRPSRVDRFIATADERPKAPWHPFPLVELSVLVGIVLIVVGLFDAGDRQGRTMLVMGLVLASLAGLDTAAREHWGGFRSHSTLLASIPSVLLAGALFFARAPWLALTVAVIATFIGALLWLRSVFRRKSGGLSIKA